MCHKVSGRKKENTNDNKEEINKLCRKKGKNMCRQKVNEEEKRGVQKTGYRITINAP